MHPNLKVDFKWGKFRRNAKSLKLTESINKKLTHTGITSKPKSKPENSQLYVKFEVVDCYCCLRYYWSVAICIVVDILLHIYECCPFINLALGKGEKAHPIN